MDDIVPALAIVAIFIGMPWIILHYVTQWKRAGNITREDENLLDELHETARRLDDRLHSIERIITADNPNWRLGDTVSHIDRLDDRR
jgi:phage shock protein B